MSEKNKLKAFSLFIMLIFLAGANTYAQQYRHQMEKIKNQRIAFFTEKLELSAIEAEKFWPVYNDYYGKKERISFETRKLHRYLMSDFQNLTDQEIKTSMDEYVELQNQEHELFLEYHKEFLKILPQKKVLLLYVTEVQFKQFLLNSIGEGRRGPGYGQGKYN